MIPPLADAPSQSPAPEAGTSTPGATDAVAGAAHPLLVQALEQTQINKFHVQGGWGFAAEDANTLHDRWQGRTVECTGADNCLNGADRVVDGVQLQSKYCSSPAATVDSAFGADGHYRYGGQVLEVPKDQHAACVELMREKIAQGKVPGVTDPAQADQMVRSGHVTYAQARRIAEAGTFDGLVFDAKTHAVGAACAGGVSAIIAAGLAAYRGRRAQAVAFEAAKAGAAAGGVTLATGVATSQFLRTRAGAVTRVVARKAVKAVHSTDLGKTVIKKVASASLGKAVGGGAAINHVAKLARSNAVTSVVSTALMTGPDAYRALVKKTLSWPQFGKNLAVRGANVAGGAGGWAAGAVGGAALGSIVPGVGTAVGGVVGGIAGSLSGGLAAGWGSKKLLDLCVDDDNWALLQTVPDVLGRLAADLQLTEAEVVLLSREAQRRIRASFLRDWQRARHRDAYLRGAMEPLARGLVRRRGGAAR